MVLVLLTLQKHQDGIWVTRLVKALREECGCNGYKNPPVKIIPVEKFFDDSPVVETLFDNITGIINRVSDAADPVAFKATVTILTAARQFDIPVFNGPQAYTLCANKYCHHLLFHKAGVNSPPSHVMANATAARIVESISTNKNSLKYPILTKPNAGGFGAGIYRVEDDSNNAVQSLGDEQLTTPDGVLLLQNYMHPSDNHIYRAWFLNGKVQCGVKRLVHDTTDDISSGCAGGICQRRMAGASKDRLMFVAFDVPKDVQEDIAKIVAQMPDAHAGSIEYLHGPHSAKPLYFDLNLLSTLPLPEPVQDAHKVWGQDYDPWLELARSVLCVLGMHGETDPST